MTAKIGLFVEYDRPFMSSYLNIYFFAMTNLIKCVDIFYVKKILQKTKTILSIMTLWQILFDF